MSRGLSREQRLILEALGECKHTHIEQLSFCVYHEIDMRWNNDDPAARQSGRFYPNSDRPRGKTITRSQYVATARAVKSLERRGLVKCEPVRHTDPGRGVRGGTTRGVLISKC